MSGNPIPLSQLISIKKQEKNQIPETRKNKSRKEPESAKNRTVGRKVHTMIYIQHIILILSSFVLFLGGLMYFDSIIPLFLPILSDVMFQPIWKTNLGKKP